MPLPTAVVSNGFRFMIGATEHNCDIVSLEEVVSQYGGEEIQTACGVMRTPLSSTITGIKVVLVENLAAAGLFMYLRDNVSAGAEVALWCGTLNPAEGATNPEWSATVNGWVKPALKAQAAGGFPTTETEFSFSTVPVKDVTP